MPKEIWFGDRVTLVVEPVVPLPVKLATWGAFGALSEILKDAVRAPKSLDRYRPGTSLEVFSQSGRLVLVGREFVIVVVVCDVLERRDRFGRTE